MLFQGTKKEALAIHKSAVEKYNNTITDVQKKCETLYVARQKSAVIIEEIEALVNSIANASKEFSRPLARVRTEKMRFRETEKYAAESYEAAVKSGGGVAAGVTAGGAIASMAPTAAMWVATTFGTASTGTAISTLSGAVAKKAALAWLGGGALAAGGGGAAAGQALLALAGPIGWSISAVTTTGSIIALSNKNKKVSKEAFEEAKRITIAGAELNETGAIVANLHSEMDLLLDKISGQMNQAERFEGQDYSALSDDEQLLLGTLVNNTLSLAEMLNKTVE
jgi:hypothetical protein